MDRPNEIAFLLRNHDHGPNAVDIDPDGILNYFFFHFVL